MSGPRTTTILTAGSTASTVSFSHVLLLLVIVVAGMLLAGVLVSVSRAKVQVRPDPGAAPGAPGRQRLRAPPNQDQ
jgi:hypothetical protein